MNQDKERLTCAMDCLYTALHLEMRIGKRGKIMVSFKPCNAFQWNLTQQQNHCSFQIFTNTMKRRV